MKRKILIYTILFIASFFLIIDKAKAAVNVTTYFKGGEYSTGIKWSDTGKSGSMQTYKDHIKYIKANGQEAPAFCLDPGLKLRTGTTYRCSPTNEPGILYLLDEVDQTIINDQTKYTFKQLAFRMYASYNSMYSSKMTPMKSAILHYTMIARPDEGWTTNFYCQADGSYCSDIRDDYLNSPDDTFNSMIQTEAVNKALSAWFATRDGTAAAATGTRLTFTQASASKDLIVYNIDSVETIKKIKFVCEGCTISGPDDNWDKKHGTLSVIPAPNCQPFKIKAYYEPEGAYLCVNANHGRTEEYQYLVTKFDSDDHSGQELDTSGEPNAEYTDAGVGCVDCCTEAPEIKPNYIEGNVSNCCYDNTHSEAREYNLNDLFCKHTELMVDHYWKKCKNDSYIDEKMTGNLNEYCKMYCTERVSVDIPGAITATSGRYFDLTTTVQGTKSPYVEGYKRCRTIIDYDTWHRTYLTAVKAEIDNYNLYQRNRAHELAYTEAIDNKEERKLDINISCTWTTSDSKSCEYPYEYPCATNPSGVCPDTREETHSHPKPDDPAPYSAQLTYYYYSKYNLPYYKYHNVRIDETKENDANHIHNGVTMKYDSTETPSASDLNWSAAKGDDPKTHAAWTGGLSYISTYNGQTKTQSEGGMCNTNVTWTLTCGSMPSLETTDIFEIRDNYKDAALGANEAYNAAADTAKDLEDKIDKCDLYFEKYEGKNARENFEFNALFDGFEYTQVYLNDYGNLVKSTNLSEFTPAFSEGNCQITGPTFGPDPIDGLVEPQYSDALHYSTGKEIMEDFKNTSLEWQSDPNGFRGYLHDKYESDKKFVQDAKYKAVCYWNESENTKYTLIPRGTVESSTFNVTLNNRQYFILLSTLEGTYDTRWLLSNLGTYGKFDKFFAENGQTCSPYQSASTDGLFHCGLRVEHEIVYTGKCNGDKTTVNPDDCDPAGTTDINLNFKIADPKNIFPSCSGDSCEYGYNWFQGTNGPETLRAIERDGANDSTYSPSHLSYSVTLTTKDMSLIKKYNEYRENNRRGGYSDFNLSCSCPSEPEECNEVGGNQTCKRSSSCTKCTSIFMTNLYQGRVEYGGSSYSVTGGNGNIQTIRDSKVHWSGE